VSLRSARLDELAIPDGTTVEEHDLVTDGDVVVGGQSTVEFGVRAGDVMAGERVEFGGRIEAEGDCRLDMWSTVAEDVLVGGDAYVGERVTVDGDLRVAGNADIGDDVEIGETFEASGHIEIRNPMPTVVFLVVYLSQLLRIGEEEAAEELADQLIEADEGEAQPVVIPRSAHVSDDAWRVSTPAAIGENCRLHGNIRAESMTVGSETTVFGSLRAKADVAVGERTEIKGDVTTRGGDVRIEENVHIWGDVSAEDVELHEHAVVEGTIRVSGELTQVRDALGPEPADEPATGDEEVTGSTDDADESGDDAVEQTDDDEKSTDDPEESVDESGTAAAEAEADTKAAEAEAEDEEETETGSTEIAIEDAEKQRAGSRDEGGDDDSEGNADPPTVESREAVEESLDGVVPMIGESPDPEPRNDQDGDAELAEVE
jgi:predicted acyltransferase (DUF342 family)